MRLQQDLLWILNKRRIVSNITAAGGRLNALTTVQIRVEHSDDKIK